METNKPLILNVEEAKKYLEDYIRIFLRILGYYDSCRHGKAINCKLLGLLEPIVF